MCHKGLYLGPFSLLNIPMYMDWLILIDTDIVYFADDTVILISEKYIDKLYQGKY
jgi:hypothetical protein